MNPLILAIVAAAGIAGQYAVMRHVETRDLPPYHYGSIYPQVVANVVDHRRSAPGIEVDALYHPGETVDYAQVVVDSAMARVSAHGGSLSRAELDAVLELAGWPEEWRDEAASVAWCESRWSPYASNGSVHGIFQLWPGWMAYAGLDVQYIYDPVQNAMAALTALKRDVKMGRDPWTQWACKPS